MSKPNIADGLAGNATGTSELRIITSYRGSAIKCCNQLVMSVRGRGWGNINLWAVYFLFFYENETKAAQMIKMCVESNWGGADI